MNANQKILAELLLASIRNRKIQNASCGSINWEEIYKEAKDHGILALLYPVMKDINSGLAVSGEIMYKWNKAALSLSMFQLQLMKDVQNIFLAFHEAGIKAIALKGIVLRELYPYPELRTMGDADILVHREDMDRAAAVLAGLGFGQGAENPEHVEFMNKNNSDVELHWTLIGDERFRSCVRLEETVWDRAVETTVFDAPALMLCKEDNFLYTGLHMAKHILDAGFGLRQLSDFALLYESVKQDIDWNAFFNKLKIYNVDKFFILLFLACRQLFNIELPECRQLKGHGSNKYASLLIEEIFEGGLFGYRSMIHTFGSFAVRKVKKETGIDANPGQSDDKKIVKPEKEGKYRYLRQLAFPPVSQLGARYRYAVRFPVLLPVAYIHRFIINLFRKELSFKEKINFSKQYSKRSQLLGWLNIR